MLTRNLWFPRWLFDERKTVAFNLPFSNKKEHFLKKFCEKLEFYTNAKWKSKIQHHLGNKKNQVII